MRFLTNLWRSIRTPLHEKVFTEVVRSRCTALDSLDLGTQFEAVRSRYRGDAELGGEFPYISIAVRGSDLALYYPLISSHSTQATLLGRLDEFRGAHRLGMMARCATELFWLMVSRVTAEGSSQREQLLRLIDEPNYIPPKNLLSESRLWLNVEQWANIHLPTLWGKVRPIKSYFDTRLEGCARSQGIPDTRLQQLRDRNIHMLIVHDGAAAAFEKPFHGKAKDVFAALQKTGWKPDVVEELTGSDLASLFAGDDCGLKQIFDLVITLRIHTVTSQANLLVPARIVL